MQSHSACRPTSTPQGYSRGAQRSQLEIEGDFPDATRVGADLAWPRLTVPESPAASGPAQEVAMSNPNDANRRRRQE
jgi:hypothetical protein